MLPDKSLHIGKAPSNALWALQGSPRLLNNGRNVVAESIKRDQLGTDIWRGANYRTAAGITLAGTMLIVRTFDKLTLDELAALMLHMGCVGALNADGGGSSYMWPLEMGWGRRLGAALVVKKGEVKFMGKLIAICDGHGMETPGKRTPMLPDGKVMKENEFNRDVAKLLDVHLRRCGFRTLLVAPTDVDTPLSVRTALANKEKADFYISIHANAYGSGGFNSVRGIETYHYPGSTKGKAAAEILHRHLIAGTALPNRGVKEANFEVLRETTMPAVLVEAGFMTNAQDSALLLSDAYRTECAEELARGICELYGVAYVRPAVTEPAETMSDLISIRVNGKLLGLKGTLANGVTTVPVRAVAEALGLKVAWDGVTRTIDLEK
ncbi:N-acetylmuramoyl-L-alanine amidase [Paenibacillus harenae]|uniref:N-acetylmuramoyl-L-alanine amidase n=2 Tax=Paenibacillus harenae TaxID=306543 RepID=A0ABT9U5K0_PAEHA|nr:N-acetylmuramoyl-L-alanine amidase [Paenibacillus harenae]